MLVKLRGLLISVSPKETTERGTDIIKIYVKVPEKINEFGEIYQKETIFEIKAIGKQIGILPAAAFKVNDTDIPERVEVNCYLNSMVNEYDGKKYYNINLSLAKLEII